jgi:hypothetical protein
VFRFPVSGDKLPKLPAGASVGGVVEYYSFEMERVKEETPEGKPEKEGMRKKATTEGERLKLLTD